MVRIIIKMCVLFTSVLFVHIVDAESFSFTFEWGNIPSCSSGSPDSVSNPIFNLSNVPPGTKEIYFTMTDTDAPGYDHGGGTVSYNGEKVIKPGTFDYFSPCPPDGEHTYEWEAEAVDGDEKTLGNATAQKVYP
jgi:phosphatidylethanolamine-binding protein (PEBP) family uncharacterized protein